MPNRPAKQQLTRHVLQRAIVDGRTNLLETVDQRYAPVRRLKALIEDLIYDHASDRLTAAELCLIRRVGFLQLQAELIESHWATRQLGRTPTVLGAKQFKLYVSTTNALRRLIRELAQLRPPESKPLLPALRPGQTYDREQARAYLESRGIHMDRIFDPPREESNAHTKH